MSDPVTITVDTVRPAETIGGLAVNGNDAVNLAAQAGRAITVTGTLSAGLQPGESVTLVLPDGTTETVTPGHRRHQLQFLALGGGGGKLRRIRQHLGLCHGCGRQ